MVNHGSFLPTIPLLFFFSSSIEYDIDMVSRRVFQKSQKGTTEHRQGCKPLYKC